MKLNLGCASQVIEGWVNVDYAFGARIAKVPFFRALNKKIKVFNIDWNENILITDLTKEFPWPNQCVDIVYSSHTLEHFTKEEGRRFLQECYRVMKIGSVIRVIVPDLRSTIDRYLEGDVKASDVVEKLGVLYEDRNGFLNNQLSVLIQCPHKCMYDTSALLDIMSEVGFHSSLKEAFDSEIPDIQAIEIKERTIDAVIVEGRKSTIFA